MTNPIFNLGNEIQVHSLLGFLYERDEMNCHVLKGYVGPSSKESHIRLYPDLDDLSNALEVSKSDILGHSPAPDSLLPLGGTIIWLRADARVVVAKSEVKVLTPSSEKQSVGIGGIARNKGRLKILLRSDGGDVCQSRCGTVCQSRCGTVCQSRCSRCRKPCGPT
jgi:hypothetical protein